MRISTVNKLVKQGFKNIITHRVIALISITTVIISLTILGLFQGMSILTKQNLNNIKEKMEVVAFIQNGTPQETIDKIKDELKGYEHIKDITYVSPDEALEKYKKSFEEENDQDMLGILNSMQSDGGSPISPSFDVKLDSGDNTQAVREKLQSYKEIYKVNDANVVVNLLNKVNSALNIASIVILVILGIASIILISNTIKVSVYVRKNEISIMRFIGAANSYIRLPFIVEGFIIGVIGSLLATAVLIGVYDIAMPKIADMFVSMIGSVSLISIVEMFGKIMLPLVSSGVVLGVLGSIVSIKKYLKI